MHCTYHIYKLPHKSRCKSLACEQSHVWAWSCFSCFFFVIDNDRVFAPRCSLHISKSKGNELVFIYPLVMKKKFFKRPSAFTVCLFNYFVYLSNHLITVFLFKLTCRLCLNIPLISKKKTCLTFKNQLTFPNFTQTDSKQDLNLITCTNHLLGKCYSGSHYI